MIMKTREEYLQLSESFNNFFEIGSKILYREIESNEYEQYTVCGVAMDSLFDSYIREPQILLENKRGERWFCDLFDENCVLTEDGEKWFGLEKPKPLREQLKELKHFRDSTVGLWATDKHIDDIAAAIRDIIDDYQGEQVPLDVIENFLETTFFKIK